MKAELNEYSGCFQASFTAETVEEAALLVRLGMNSTKELKFCSTDAYKDGDIHTYITIGKRKKDDSAVPKNR